MIVSSARQKLKYTSHRNSTQTRAPLARKYVPTQFRNAVFHRNII